MLQYQHMSVATFEGYVGTSQVSQASETALSSETVRAPLASIDTLARHVEVLTLENHALRRSDGHDTTLVSLSGAEPGR